MNEFQKLWWEQARSDHEILSLLRENGAGPCHQLHYLQMVTEKLAKAYFWGAKSPPKNKSHAGFGQFMRALASFQGSKLDQLAMSLGFKSVKAFETWIRDVHPLVYALERLAPALAQDGPNPEYPWPHDSPADNPVRHQFEVWVQLTETWQGRRLIKAIGPAVERFPSYA